MLPAPPIPDADDSPFACVTPSPHGVAVATPHLVTSSPPDVASMPGNPLPPLRDEDARLIGAWLDAGPDFRRIAARLDLQPHEVLQRLSAEPIASYIAAAKAAGDESLHARALARLAHLMETAPNPTQQRLAATTVLRATEPCHRSQIRRGGERGPTRSSPSTRTPRRVVGAKDSAASSPPRADPSWSRQSAVQTPPRPTAPSQIGVPRLDRPLPSSTAPPPSTAGKSESRRGDPCEPSSTPSAPTPPDPPTTTTRPASLPSGPLPSAIPAPPLSPVHLLTCSPAQGSSPHPPTAACHPGPHHAPETAVRAVLDALKINDSPEPDSGIGTLYAFTAADDTGQPVPWPRFYADFRWRLAPALLGHTKAATRPAGYTPAPPPEPPPQWPYPARKTAPQALARSIIRADLEHPSGRRAAVHFHLAQHHPPGNTLCWLIRAVELTDSS